MRREYGDKGFYITLNIGCYSCRGYSIMQTAKKCMKGLLRQLLQKSVGGYEGLWSEDGSEQ